MDCSISNFLIVKSINNSGNVSEGERERLIRKFTAEDSVLRNALFSSGLETDEKRKAVYPATLLTKYVVGAVDASGVDIEVLQAKVEDICRGRLEAAGDAFMATVKANPEILESLKK